jgi:LmbE family N-acetylglucosaminyl deacetylase
MRYIYISPHFDDAVLSCGGLIHEQTRKGLPVEIWTVFGGLPSKDKPLSALAQRIHRMWGTKSGRGTIILRRKEDRTAAKTIGATVRHLTFPDCIYRWSSAGEPLYLNDVFDPPHAEDAGLPESIAQALQRGLHKTDVVVAPLAVGHHIDHVLTRLGVERVSRSLQYYVDVPYIINFPEQVEPATRSMSSQLFRVTRTGLKAWRDGISAYTSQVPSLFRPDKPMKLAIQEYWSREKGIRLWRPR